MFACTALKKKVFIFEYFLHIFSTVSSQSTLILHEVFRDYQINLENTGKFIKGELAF